MTQRSLISRVNAGIASLALLAMMAFLPLRANGESVILRNRAYNPSTNESQKVLIQFLLPKPARPVDIIEAGDLEITYDVQKGLYRAHKEIELAPQQRRTFQVELRDIWTIPPESVQELQKHAAKMAAALRGSQALSGKELQALVDKNAAALLERQEAASITKVKAIDHIRAYEVNQELLERVRKDLGVLENLVIEAGEDPGVLLGSARSKTVRSFQPTTADEGKGDVVLKIKVTNTSPTEKRKVPVMHDLAPEITPADVLDAGGLEVGYDSSRGICYLHLEEVELEKLASREFIVRVRNRWDVSEKRVVELEARATNLVTITREQERYGSVRDLAEGIVKELQVTRQAKAPLSLSPDYVAWCREQDRKLKSIEGKIVRLEELFQPRQLLTEVPDARILERIQPPSRKNTWIIIWIILGFLGVLSLLFFLRWYGRSKVDIAVASALEKGAVAPASPPPAAAKAGSTKPPEGAK